MKYVIIRFDYEKFYTHAYFKNGSEDFSNENIVGYANTQKEASKQVKDLGSYILK